MSLHLYDTRSRSVREFTPLRAGEASMYVCGITVQGKPHIGHIRFAVAFDILRRWLLHTGYEVTYVRNVTDIDDKILLKSAELDRPWWEFAYANERASTRAYDVLGNLPPTYEPRATGHIPEMIELIGRLVDAGHAYVSGGDVYFDVRSYPEYGALSGQKVDDLLPAGDTDTDDLKRDPRDFALWKGTKPGEPATASWATPWGPGRPGWHLECSAMATKYLGPTFDLHGGGIDLRFPHHENELAQSAAAGDPFARYWLHNGWVTLGGTKMSKSLGNTELVEEVVRRVRPIELRYYLAAAHYRSTIEFTEAALREAAAGFRRLESFVSHASERVGVVAPSTTICAEFVAAMDDDLGVPAALAAVHETVREGNAALAAGDTTAVTGALGAVRAMLGVLGLDPFDPQWTDHGTAGSDLTEVVGTLVHALLEQRQQARARKDFAVADALRDQLKAAGIAVEDGPGGPRWSFERG